jgi:VWFA-related protein
MPLARALAAVLLVLLLVPGGAAPGAAGQDADPPAGDGAQDAAAEEPQQPPIFRGGVDFVRVDVLVHDRDDEPVIDLTEADFEILEDGVPQQIEQFTVVRIEGGARPAVAPRREIRTRADEERVVGSDDVRVFVLFLDDYHVRKSNSMQVRLPLTNFLRTELGPNDIVAVMYPLMSVQELSFTRDHESVVRALESFQGRKYDYTPLNEFERRYVRASTEVVERIRNEVVMTALRGLAVRLGGIREGRKSVIFVSEGFTVMLPPQMRRGDASMPINPFAPTDADPRFERSAEAFSEADLYNQMRLVFDAANRNNTAIYSLDPRGLAVFEFDIDDTGAAPLPDFATDRRVLQSTQDTLRTLSEQTDGRAIVNRNSLDEGLAQIVEDASFYDLIGYTSSQSPDDGKFHEIRVRVDRPGVDVRARRGFWALTPEEAERAAAPPAPVVATPVQQALASISPAVRAGKFVKTWLGTERGTDGRTRVTVVWEPLPVPPGERREAASGVSLLVANAAGDLVYRGRAPERSAGGEPPHRLSFEAAPGQVELRLTVEGPGGGTLDQELTTFDVPDFTVPEVRLGTPRVFRGRTVAELRALGANVDAVPTALREFSRTERLLIRFDAYGPGGAPVEPTAALLNRGGDRMAEVPVAVASAGGTHQIDLGLAGLAPGEYLLEISVAGSEGDLSELVPLRVGS